MNSWGKTIVHVQFTDERVREILFSHSSLAHKEHTIEEYLLREMRK